jgi:site-specific recombinase XerD
VPLPPQVLTRKRSFRPLWATSGEGFSSPQRRPTHESIDVLIAHQVEDVRDKQPVKRRYVDQVSVSLRPNTVRHIELDLRRFGTWLTNHHPDVACCADLERHHIEAFKTWLSTTPTPGTGKPLNRVSIKNALINLRIPVGKLHNDRYIPLHPQLKGLLDDWVNRYRPNGLRSDLLLIEHNRPISRQRVATALHRLGTNAGIGHITAHRLRHTLATQAINRGMRECPISGVTDHGG